MKVYISVTKENRDFIAKTFNISSMSVWRALFFDSRAGFTEQAKRIRKLAMLRGGVLMAKGVAVETLYDVDGIIRQYFPNDVLLEINKETCQAVIMKDGEIKKAIDNVKLSDMDLIQAEALDLSDGRQSIHY